MDIRGKIALVTGANRGLGRAFAEALLEAGATKVYAGARDPSAVIDPRVTPIHVDVTSSRDIAAAAATCTDIEILINNAGAMLATPVLAENSEDVLRREMEVNVFGMLAMSRAFAPVLARNGEIDTEMGATLSSGPKTSPRQVAEKTIQGIRSGIEHVVADDSATSLWQATRQDLIKMHADMQARWDQHLGGDRM